MTSEQLTPITVRLPDELRMQLVIYAAKNKVKIGALVTEAIKAYLLENDNATA